MGGYKTTREIIDGHAVERPAAGHRLTLRADAFALGGEEAVAALEGSAPPREAALDGGRVLLFAGDCRGGGSARLAPRARAQAEAFGFQLVHPAAGCGPRVLAERGLARPGNLVAALGLPGGEACGVGALIWPVGAEALPGLLARGVFEAGEPDVHRVECGGALGPGVTATDVGLYVAGQFGRGGAGGAVMEFGGAVLEAAGEGNHAGLAEAAGLCGPAMVLCAPGTPAAAYDAYYEYDFTNLVPQCAAAAPGSSFDVRPLVEAAGAFVHRVVVGPAASAEDIRQAARFLGGRRIHSDVQLWVSPASRQIHFGALARGDLAALIDAGASVLPSCTLPWAEELTSGGGVAVTGVCAFEVCRERGVEVYYVNAYAAAAAALAGELCEPTPICEKLG
jgi:3-isopropylmalate/(R)-2-methylmalate dehydratase large subunit